jgi:hypothetical protein
MISAAATETPAPAENLLSSAVGIVRLFGILHFHRGYTFASSGLTIRIVEGRREIRSTLALLIGVVLAGYHFLWCKRKQVTSCFWIIRIVIFESGLRILNFAILAVSADAALFYGYRRGCGDILFWGLP